MGLENQKSYVCLKKINLCHFRGRGPLKSTMDVINAAKKISEAGTKLDKLSRAILDMVRYYMCWSG